MKVRRFETDPTSDDESPFKIKFAKPVDFESNTFSILIGPNGTRKSRTLRDILDTSLLRSRDDGLTHSGKLNAVEFWRRSASSPVPGISKILAISGVATDRFPSRITGRRIRALPVTYAYVGPRTDNNLVSRAQSINQIARSLIEHPERIKIRHKQLRHAFSLLHLDCGILFELVRTEAAPDKKWSIASLRKRLDSSMLSEEDQGSSDVLRRGLQILNHHAAPIELRLDLDDDERIAATPGDLEALFALLSAGALTVSTSYAYANNQRRLDLANLSSGQWHILASLLFAAVAVEDHALVLIDEPENSLHPSWQQEYLPLLKATISKAKGVHVLVATHSPLIAASLRPDEAEVVKITSVGDRLVARPLKSGPFGWSADQILQEVFGLHSARSAAFTREMDRALDLLAKGQRANPKLLALVQSLRKTLPTLPDDDLTREIIETLVSVVVKEEE